ncbi:MAG: MauE/DoxX family redox-associated membrane protein [Ilumatobacteraceae bacterium]
MVAAIAAVLVGAVFLVSAITKLARPAQWRAQATELVLGGASPERLFDAVPVVEAVLGALLVVQWQRTPVALVAVAVLGAFTALLVVRILQGRRPPCACFGSLSTKPVGWSSVARNLALIALALLAALA